jgi:hypothetical protein
MGWIVVWGFLPLGEHLMPILAEVLGIADKITMNSEYQSSVATV